MQQNITIIETLSDREILNEVDGLSDKVLQKYRAKLKITGVLKTRERLLANRDVPILKEIVSTKENNPSLFYSTIIDIVIKKHFQSETLINTIFDTTAPDSQVSEKFLAICKEKGVGEDLIQDFFDHANAISDFFNHLDERSLASYFNSTVDTLISALVGHNS